MLLYFDRKYKGEWDAIMDALRRHEMFESATELKALTSDPQPHFTVTDSCYPDSLRNFSRPPFVLYYKGDLGLLGLPKTLRIGISGPLPGTAGVFLHRDGISYSKRSLVVCRDLEGLVPEMGNLYITGSFINSADDAEELAWALSDLVVVARFSRRIAKLTERFLREGKDVVAVAPLAIRHGRFLGEWPASVQEDVFAEVALRLVSGNG